MIICLMSQKCERNLDKDSLSKERNIEMQRQVNFKGEHTQEYVIRMFFWSNL